MNLLFSRGIKTLRDSVFTLLDIPHRCLDDSCVSKWAKSVKVSFKTPIGSEIAYLVINSTDLKVFGEGEWKIRKHDKERRRTWRKLHLAVDVRTHEIICAGLSLNIVTDAFPGQTHRNRAIANQGLTGGNAR